MGHSVETFGSGTEFLKADTQSLACLILDQHMAFMTGLELVETLRAHSMGIPVLLMTGSLSPAIVVRAAELGIGSRVVKKPPCDEDLLEFVNASGRPKRCGRS
jgi:FixJ family two-component response regulator